MNSSSWIAPLAELFHSFIFLHLDYSGMKDYQKDFLQLCLDYEVLSFGDFKLKSGRQSPYFFNLGKISDGQGISRLSECYAAALRDMLPSNTLNAASSTAVAAAGSVVLFGPAYKGIPLVASTSAVLYSKYGVNLGFAYNRKEAKDHGEGGQIVGQHSKTADLFLLDDVVTAGTAIRECISLIGKQWSEARVTGVLVALDRQERLSELDARSTIEAVRQDLGIPIYSIVTFSDLLEFISSLKDHSHLESSLIAYREKYIALQQK